MKQYAIVLSIFCAALFVGGAFGNVLLHPSFAQDEEGSDSGDEYECDGESFRDDEECSPDPDPACTDYQGALPQQYSFYEPQVRVQCESGSIQTGYRLTLCTDSCNDTWLDSHGSTCSPISQTNPIVTGTSSPTPTPQCEEVTAETTPGSGLQLKTLRCR